MTKPSIEIVTAVSKSGGIDTSGSVASVWHLPKDRQRSREIITGGRTYQLGSPYAMAIGARAFQALQSALSLKFDRCYNIVVHEDDPVRSVPFFYAEAPNLDHAITLAERRRSKKVFLMGDANFYRRAFDRVERLHLTVVEDDLDALEQFPEFPDFSGFELQRETPGQENDVNYVFREYVRVP